MTCPIKIFIEHLEKSLGEWIIIEYRNSYRIAGDRILVTGISIPEVPSTSRRFYELIDPGEVIILDPSAKDPLSYRDVCMYGNIVIGGILGSHPPEGRTRKMLSARFPKATKRNIGKYQFSIDGSVYIALEISRGRSLDEIPIAFGVRIRRIISRDVEHEIYLPYAYPLVNGKPMISRELIRYLVGDSRYVIEYDEKLNTIESD